MREAEVFLKTLGVVFASDAYRWLLASVMSAAMFVLPDEGVRLSLCIALGLAFLDFVTGVTAAKLSGEALRSAGIKRTVVKVTGYVVAVSVVSVSLRQVTQSLDVARIVATLLANVVLLAEAVSILENLDKMGVPLPRWVIRLLRQQMKRLNEAGAELGKEETK